MRISEALESEFTSLQQGGVLQEIKPTDFPRQIARDASAVCLQVLSCCDGHQFMDITQRTKLSCDAMKMTLGMKHHCDDCFHWKAVNGGPFVLSVPHLQVQEYRGEPDYVQRHVLHQIEEGMGLKKLNVVLLIGHAACGKVYETFRHAEEYACHMARAKERVMQEFNLPSEQVIAWLQVHRSKGRRMYHVDRAAAMRLPLAAAA